MVNVAVSGATGMVGRNVLNILEERNFPIDQLFLFASSKSAGEKIIFKEIEYEVEELNEKALDKPIDILFFASGGDISLKYAPIAQEKGIVVIDNSSVWRMDKDVPLVIPEVNADALENHKNLIANPNCSTIQSILPLKPIHDKYGIKRIIYSTYQAVSGSGVGGINDLVNGGTSTYAYEIKNNVLPHIDDFLENGYTKEEMKMINETNKILNDDSIRITATTVRVPVIHGHSVSCNLELNNEYELEDIFEILDSYPGVKVYDDLENLIYPMPSMAEGTDEVYVGRIRRDFSIDNGLNLWIVSDNTRKGAATNSVQIAELLLDNFKN